MQELVAAGRYAQALLDLARSAGKDQAIEDELQSLGAALRSSAQLRRLFASPAVEPADKRKAFDRLYAKADPAVARILAGLAAALLERGRFALMPEIASEYKRLADIAQSEATAEIRSAVPLDPAARQAIAARLEKLEGCCVAVRAEVDPSLIGGVQVRIRNKIIDGSVRGKLMRIRRELTKRAGE